MSVERLKGVGGGRVSLLYVDSLQPHASSLLGLLKPAHCSSENTGPPASRPRGFSSHRSPACPVNSPLLPFRIIIMETVPYLGVCYLRTCSCWRHQDRAGMCTMIDHSQTATSLFPASMLPGSALIDISEPCTSGFRAIVCSSEYFSNQSAQRQHVHYNLARTYIVSLYHQARAGTQHRHRVLHAGCSRDQLSMRHAS